MSTSRDEQTPFTAEVYSQNQTCQLPVSVENKVLYGID